MESLEMEIQISLELFDEKSADKVVKVMKAFEAGDRNGYDFEQTFVKLDQFQSGGKGWGRQSKGGGKGGKGSGKY